MSKKSKILTCLSILTAASLAGFLTGKSTRWDYNSPETAHLYVLMYSHWDLVSKSPLKGRLSLKAGTDVYSYTEGENEITLSALPAEEASKLRIPQEGIDKDFEKLVALLATPAASTGIIGTVLHEASEAESKMTPKEIAILGTVTVGTFALGYYIGHDQPARYDGDKFRKALKEDVYIWKEYQTAVRRCYEAERNLQFAAIGSGSDPALHDPELKQARDLCNKLHPEIPVLVQNDTTIQKLKKESQPKAK